jgi:hypothetical protein
MEEEIRGVVATGVRGAIEMCIDPVAERENRPQLVKDDTVCALGPVRSEIGEETLGGKIVQVLDEPEIVTEKIVIASDRLQPDCQAEDDEDCARR